MSFSLNGDNRYDLTMMTILWSISVANYHQWRYQD